MANKAGAVMNIQIIEIKPSVSRGTVKAFVKLSLDGIVIYDFKVIQKAGQKAWVSCPQAEWTDKSGQKHYKPVVELPEALKTQVQTAILQKWGNNGN